MALQELVTRAKTEKERNTAVFKVTAHAQLSRELAGSTSLDELLKKCAEAKALLDADFVFGYAMTDGVLSTRDHEGNELRVPVAEAGIPGFAAQSGEMVVIRDVYDDAELHTLSPGLVFDKSLDAQSGYRTRQMLVAPIIHHGVTVGIVQAINKLSGTEFDFLDVESARELARSLGPLMRQILEFESQHKQLEYQQKLNSVTNAVHAARDIDQILISLKYEIISIFEAQRITIYAVDPDTGELFSRVKEGDEIREFRVLVDTKSISGYAAFSRETVNFVDVYDDKELLRTHPQLSFNRRYDEMTNFRTKQVLASPVEFQGDLLGVVQFINRIDDNPFIGEDERRIKELSNTLAIAFHNQARIGIRRTPFDLLIKKELMKISDFAKAKETAKENTLSVEEVLMSDFDISKAQILESYSEYYGCPAFQFDPEMEIPAGLVTELEDYYDTLKQKLWIPISEEGDRITVVMRDPKDVTIRDEIEMKLRGKRVRYRCALTDDVVKTIDHLFGVEQQAALDGSVSDLLDELESEAGADIAGPLAQVKGEEEATEDDSAIVKLVNRMILDAYSRGASDIHVEPYTETNAVVRYRIDGALQKVMEFPARFRRAIVSRIKIMSDLDIAERRKPQDGKIKFARWGKLDIELRIATMPTVGGNEDVVMRILAASKPMPIADLSMSERNLREFEKVIKQPYGIILCVGPTGSGKTTTLHSALGHVNKEDVKIWTAEDPVEITQRGLRQVQVNRRAGLDFATIMRSFLRADPDIIMVGEMRDHETASTGIEASLTGHLVLSTLHTNNAPETVTRLLDMGIDEFSFADALLAVLAQRLIRTICKNCKESYHPEKEEFEELRAEYGNEKLFDATGIEYGDDMMLARSKEGGCTKCGNKGWKGRMGIHELLISNEEIRSLIYKKAKAEDVRSAAIVGGMRTLKQDGIEKVFGGHTTAAAIRSVVVQ